MEHIKGFEKELSMQFSTSYNNKRVTMGGISFVISEEVIVKAIGIPMDGRKQKRNIHVPNSESLYRFFRGKEVLVKLQGGYAREELPDLWKMVCLMVIKYFTLEGHFKLHYFYHMLLLNHFRNQDLISFPFQFLYSLEHYVKEDVDPTKSQRKKHVPMHQGLIYKLYSFHLSMCPLGKILVLETPSSRSPPLAPIFDTADPSKK